MIITITKRSSENKIIIVYNIQIFYGVNRSVRKFQLKLSLKLQLKLIRNLAKVSMKLHVKFHSNFGKHETSMDLHESSMKLQLETELN